MRKINVENSRNLRRNQTDAEKKLWSILRNRQLDGVKFRRQFAVGTRIVDFFSPEFLLAIEVDGGQHYEEDGERLDKARTVELSEQRVSILRFSNREVLNNPEGVYAAICAALKELRAEEYHPSPQSSPRRGEEDGFTRPSKHMGEP